MYYHSDVAIKCNYLDRCCTFFKSESDREEHIKAVHLASRVKTKVDCIYCGESFAKGFATGKHIKSKHGGIAIKCSIRKCAQYFKTQEDCDKHFKELHHEAEKSKTMFCPKCSYKADNKTLMQIHFLTMHGKEKLKCTQCPRSETIYKSSLSLKRHITNYHSMILVNCHHCNKSMRKINLYPICSQNIAPCARSTIYAKAQ
jgi:hypothetical protein